MPPDFLAAMRKATELTRARDPGGATRLIQELLTRHGRTREPLDPHAAPRPDQSGVIRLPAPHASPREEEATERPAGSATDRTARRRRPLGEVVRILRQFRRPPFGQAPAEHGGNRVPVPEGARFLERSFTCSEGSRTYKLYVPAPKEQPPAGLVIMLHGCTQDADDFARGTRMNLMAEKHGLLIAYPAQARTANPSLCWNWFDARHQRRAAGEPAIIAGLTRQIMAEFGLKRAFVAGLSAGGAMAAVMASTYPELYAAVGIHSGLATGAASDVVSAFTAMRGEGIGGIHSSRPARPARPVRTIVFHGDSDPTVHSTNGDRIAEEIGAAWGEAGMAGGVRPGGRRPGFFPPNPGLRSRAGDGALGDPRCGSCLVRRKPGRHVYRLSGSGRLRGNEPLLPRAGRRERDARLISSCLIIRPSARSNTSTCQSDIFRKTVVILASYCGIRLKTRAGL